MKRLFLALIALLFGLTLFSTPAFAQEAGAPDAAEQIEDTSVDDESVREEFEALIEMRDGIQALIYQMMDIPEEFRSEVFNKAMEELRDLKAQLQAEIMNLLGALLDAERASSSGGAFDESVGSR